MSKLYVVYVVLLFIGLLPLSLGIYMAMQEKKIRSRCIFKIMGTVTGYRTKGLPKYEVEYCIQGKVYMITNEYRRVSRVPAFMAANKNKPIYLDDSNVLHIILGQSYDKEVFLRKLQPIHSKIPVYYDAQDPNTAFVKEVPSYNSRVATGLSAFGAIFVALACILNIFV